MHQLCWSWYQQNHLQHKKIPTPAPAFDWFPTLADILGVNDAELLSDISPEYRALKWMAVNDILRDELLASRNNGGSTKELMERYPLVTLCLVTKCRMLAETSFCNWTDDIPGYAVPNFINCTEQGEVVGIQFRK